MALRVRKDGVRKWPVTVKTKVGDDAGNVAEVEQTFVAHWKAITEAERRQILEELDLAFGSRPTADAVLADVVGIVGDPDGAGRDPRDVLVRVARVMRRMEEESAEAVLERNAVYFGRLLAGWGDEVVGEDGQSIPFSADALHQLITGLDGNAISRALIEADNQIRYGMAPRKNASTSPAPGEASGAGEAATSSPTT
jgi:hypothetical protein